MSKRGGDPRGLIRAVHNGNNAKLKRMIRYGAAINDVRLVDSMNSALHEATARNNLTAMRILLRARADVWVLNKRRETPLHLASSAEAVHLLVDAARRLKCIRYDPLASCLQGRRRREAAARALITRGAKVNRLQSIAIAAICRGDYGSDMFRLLVEAGLDLCCRGGVCTFDTLFGCTTNYHDVALLLTLCLWERCQDGYDSIRYLATDEIRKLARAASYVPLNHRIASGPLFLETILWSEYDHLWITRALILVAAGACLSGAFSTGGTVRDAMLRDWRKYAATANCTEEVIAGFPRMLAAPTQCEARRIALELLPPGLRPDRPQKLV